MAENQILPFALDSGANVLAQNDWRDLSARLGGFEAGLARSAHVNKALRQSAFVAATVGEFIAKNALQDYNDDGNLANSVYLYEIAHRGLVSFTEDTTISIPGDYDTLQEALIEISPRFIPSNVTVVMSLGAGDHVVDSTVGTIVIHNPFADRIRIVGQPLSGAFPSDTAVNSSSIPTVEAHLRTVWPTRIVITGNRQGIYLKTNLGRLENILMIGDRTPGQHGLLIGEWQGEMASGTAQVVNCWFHNMGQDGLRCNYTSFIQGTNIGVSHCREYGLRAANMSGMQIGGSVVAVRCLFSGLAVLDNSFFEVIPGASGAFTYNTANGITAYGEGTFVSSGAASLKLQNNSSYGCVASNGAYADFPPSAVGGSNGSGTDCFAVAGSNQMFNGGLSLSASPTRGSVGNANAYSG